MSDEAEALPSFDEVADQFIALGALGSPAELHGMLCGRLAGGKRYGEREWLESAMEFLDVGKNDPGAEAAVGSLYRITLSQLRDEQISLQLLLPGEDVEMPQRLLALSHWCQGFLNGFGTSGVTADTQLSSDTAEALRDFAGFAQINTDPDEEDSETDYQEVIEYVRLAVLSIFMEIGSGAARDDAAGEGDDGEQPIVH